MPARTLLAALAALAVAAGGYLLLPPRPPAPPPAAPPATRPAQEAPPPPGAFDPMKDTFTLPEGVVKYVWDIEHLAFFLGTDLGPHLTAALRAGNFEAWLPFLADGFASELFTGEGTELRHAVVQETTWRAGRDPVERGDAAAFLERLRGWRARFERIDRVSVHFEQLSPERRGELAGAFDATATLHFAGTLRSGGIAEEGLECAFRFEQLTDTPLEQRKFLASARSLRAWSRRAPGPLTQEITDSSGIEVYRFLDTWYNQNTGAAGTNSCAYLLDYDRDGIADLLIPEDRAFLYRGLGDGTFRDVTAQAGLPNRLNARLSGATVIDADNDGWEDLLFDRGSRRTGGRDRMIFRNRGDGTFVRLEEGEFDLPPIDLANGAVADYDGDGLVDLYLHGAGERPPKAEIRKRARWVGDRSHRNGVLLRNLGGWKFENVTARSGTGGQHRSIFASLWLDVDGDGDCDLLLAHHLGDNALLVNDGAGGFTERRASPGYGGMSMGAAAADLDADGDPDAYLANMSSHAGNRIMANLRAEDYPPGLFEMVKGFVEGNQILENRGAPGRWGEILHLGGSQAGGWAYGPALPDLDGDGLPDIYCPAGFQSVERGKPDG